MNEENDFCEEYKMVQCVRIKNSISIPIVLHFSLRLVCSSGYFDNIPLVRNCSMTDSVMYSAR